MSDFTFDFVVTEPVKIGREGARLAHWKYRVDTKTNASTYTRQEYGVYRRFNDFLWLRKQLIHAYPGNIVPPLPEKDVRETLDKIFGTTDESKLHKFRQRALRKFLVRVGAHPTLAKSTALQEFIELDDDDFIRRQNELSSAPSTNDLFAGSRLKHLQVSITSKLSSDIESLTLGHNAREDAIDPKKKVFYDKQAYLVKLETTLLTLRDKFENVSQQRRTFQHGAAEVGKAFLKVSEVEAQHDQSDLKYLTEIGSALSQDGENSKENAEREVTQIVESLTYYSSLCRAGQGVINYLKDVWTLQKVFKSDADALRKKKERGSTDVTIDSQIQSAIEKCSSADQHQDVVSSTFLEEMDRFELEKQHDLKSVLQMYVDITVKFAASRSGIWEAVSIPE
eukprot:TRINITY_DN13534_c0_g1_i1.p1 TRINITY_DN13534_c0_g1~~TRINITY_DN13534_c0_g1_i1.p1  ORF type:complete len:395 (+),score=66.81 TRINITY_DN13534_c0_g1_i1:93-1277(+)